MSAAQIQSSQLMATIRPTVIDPIPPTRWREAKIHARTAGLYLHRLYPPGRRPSWILVDLTSGAVLARGRTAVQCWDAWTQRQLPSEDSPTSSPFASSKAPRISG